MDQKVWRSCGKKKRYKDEHEARQALKHCQAQRNTDLDFYYCTYCNGYHLTSKGRLTEETHTTWKPDPNEIVKDKNCIGCEHIFKCKGKPRSVKLCVNYEERKKQ